MGIKRKITDYVSNLPGWRVDRKIIVFESDDWGSVRMPSKSVFNKLERYGLDLRSRDAERYNLNDSLATSQDMEMLFEVLSRFTDVNGNKAVFTPVSLVANPDFLRIKESGYSEYYYEPFTETLKRQPGCENSYSLWFEGINNKLFVPQMHGREHLNVIAWLNALQKGDRQALMAFQEGFWGFVPEQTSLPGVDFQAAFLLSDPEELKYHEKVIKDGLELFEKLFGYRAVYFVPPNGPFNNSLNVVLAENGIKFRMAAKIQNEYLGFGRTRKIIHWLGQKEKHGVVYMVRNCFFEPSKPGRDWIDACLGKIQSAFRTKKPAIISTHRVNYVGGLNPANRDKGLRQLNELLRTILNKWPDVEFLTTAELGKLMLQRL